MEPNKEDLKMKIVPIHVGKTPLSLIPPCRNVAIRTKQTEECSITGIQDRTNSDLMDCQYPSKGDCGNTVILRHGLILCLRDGFILCSVRHQITLESIETLLFLKSNTWAH